MNIAKFVRTRFILKTAGTWEIHRLTESNIKTTLKMKWDLKKILVELAYLYIKTRTYWLVNSEMDGLKLLFRKNKTKPHRILLKTICNTTESSWNLIYINIYLTNCTQNFTKQQLLLAALPKKNIFCSTVGEWYKELKLKDFCVFDFIELLFNGVLRNNSFKKRILQITS